MHSKVFRLVLVCGSSLLLVHSAIGQIIPAPATPPPIVDPGTILGPTPNPTPPGASPTIPPVNPPPTPTVPPVNPPPTPTVPPINPPPTPTVPPVNPPPTPTVPPINPPSLLQKADPQLARALVRFGQNGVLSLANDRGRFQKVALQPNQVVTVTLTLSLKDYGKAAAVQILDGGAMTTSLAPLPDSNPASAPAGPEPTPTPPLPVISPPPIPDPSTLVDTGQLMTVSQAGKLIFSFKPGADIGLHRVSVIVGDNQYFLQFWRQDMNNPVNNPRMLRAY